MRVKKGSLKTDPWYPPAMSLAARLGENLANLYFTVFKFKLFVIIDSRVEGDRHFSTDILIPMEPKTKR